MIQRLVAKRYAKGLFLVGEKNGDYRSYFDDMEKVVSTVEGNERLKRALMLPLLEMEKRKEILSDVVRSLDLSPVVSTTLLLLMERNRMGYLPLIRDMYVDLMDAKEGRVKGSLYSAYPVSPDVKKRVEEALGEKLQKTVELATVEDKSLIGGLKVVLGGLRIDGTVKRQLEILNERITKE